MNDLLAHIRVCQTMFSATSNVSATLIFRWWIKITSHLNKNIIHLRSSHRSFSVKKGVLRNFVKFTGKHLCQSLFFNKVAALASNFIKKKRLWHRCFPVNFTKFLRTPFLQNICGRLLLTFQLNYRKIINIILH